MTKEFNILDSVHPDYSHQILNWEKFRYIMEGGDNFVSQYLASYSDREQEPDFNRRKKITPIPSFASAAVTDIKNAIFQRMTEIIRQGGSNIYQAVMAGDLGGVDLLGATMNYFVGNEILPELLNMGKVGIYVDMPMFQETQTLNTVKNIHPYFYKYRTEQIRNWRYSKQGEFIQFDMLLLKEQILTYDNFFQLPDNDVTRYRLLTKEDGTILVRFFDMYGNQISMEGESSNEPIELGINRIPFVILELNHSLLQNIANHQIALLNLESSDISYALLSNFPFYIEQQNRIQSPHLKTVDSESETKEIELGGTVGRSYSSNVDPPSFIHPSSEPLLASMEKQKSLKEDIRSIVQLALSAIQPKYASAQAKEFDEHGLESGLSFLGLILEHGERQLASYFSEYENVDEIAMINYPERYSLKSDQERIDEAKSLYDILLKIPSKSAQKAMTKLMVKKLLEARMPGEELNKIFSEIDKAKYITSDPNIIQNDWEKGFISTNTASKARGYDSKTEVPQAMEDHANRIKRIQAAQSPIDDLNSDPKANAKLEKKQSQDPDLQDTGSKAVRKGAKK